MAILALSSGESELAAVVKATGEGLGFQSSLADFNLALPLEIHSDATAAIGMCKRQGLGRVRQKIGTMTALFLHIGQTNWIERTLLQK